MHRVEIVNLTQGDGRLSRIYASGSAECTFQMAHEKCGHSVGHQRARDDVHRERNVGPHRSHPQEAEPVGNQAFRHEQSGVGIVVDQPGQLTRMFINKAYACHLVPREIAIGLFNQCRRQRRYDEASGGEIGGARGSSRACRQPTCEHPTVGEQGLRARLSPRPFLREGNDDAAAGQTGPRFAQSADARRILFIRPHWIDENFRPLG